MVMFRLNGDVSSENLTAFLFAGLYIASAYRDRQFSLVIQILSGMTTMGG